MSVVRLKNIAVLTYAIILLAEHATCEDVSTEWNTNTTFKPLASNSVTFSGFNFTNLTTADTITFSPSSETWKLQLNYSIEPLDTTGNSDLFPVYSYALQFPEHQLPAQNQSTWQMCASFLQFPFPDNITNLAVSSDTVSGDCTPYLGEACIQDYVKAMTGPRRFLFCPFAPTFGSIPSCLARIGSQSPNSILSTQITNWVSWDVAHDLSNNTYTNSTTGQLLTDPDIHGLRSGQTFWKQSPDLGALKNVTLQEEQASTLQFVVLSQFPSDAWFANEPEGAVNPTLANVRLICGRANTTYNGNVSDAQRPATNRAASITFGMMPLGIVLAILTCVVINIVM